MVLKTKDRSLSVMSRAFFRLSSFLFTDDRAVAKNPKP